MPAGAFLRSSLMALCLTLGAGSATAQDVGVVQSDVLVINPDRLFAETGLGQAMNDELQAQRDSLIAHNRKLEAELEAEEKALSELRSETNPDEFRDLADAFDTKVRSIRQDSERRARDLDRARAQAPVTFMRLVEPVLVDIMQDADAAVIMDSRTVLLRVEVVEITDVAISRIDEQIGSELPEGVSMGRGVPVSEGNNDAPDAD